MQKNQMAFGQIPSREELKRIYETALQKQGVKKVFQLAPSDFDGGLSGKKIIAWFKNLLGLSK